MDVVDHPDLPEVMKVMQAQLHETRVHLYGAISTSTKKSNTVQKFFNKHADTDDASLVWLDLVDTQDNDGNKETREA